MFKNRSLYTPYNLMMKQLEYHKMRHTIIPAADALTGYQLSNFTSFELELFELRIKILNSNKD